jgi:hypothetical protein
MGNKTEIEARFIAAIWAASPEGRLERLEVILQEMRDSGEDCERFNYRKQAELARYFWSQGEADKALVRIGRAEQALHEMDYSDDTDRKRGKGTLRAASNGGNARAEAAKVARRSLLEEMVRLLAQNPGKSVTWAAHSAHKRGLGTSPGANRQAWNRHKKNL